MNFRCTECGTSNVFWRSTCVGCGARADIPGQHSDSHDDLVRALKSAAREAAQERLFVDTSGPGWPD